MTTSELLDVGGVLLRQHDIALSLLRYHLNGLTTDDCLRRPAAVGLHVRLVDGAWVADWPEHEGYDLGPSSIAWLSWQAIWWWSTVIDRVAGPGTLQRDDVVWPGSAEGVVAAFVTLAERWRDIVAGLDAAALASTTSPRWPDLPGPFVDVVAWLNVELMKTAAEIGSVRFMLGAQRVGT